MEATTIEPTAGLNPAATELRDTARRIEAHREAAGFTQAQLLKSHPGLGTSKTWWRILHGPVAELEELDINARLLAARQALAIIEESAAAAASSTGSEKVYDDLTPALRLRSAFLETTAEKGNARVILMTGLSGTGKTSARLALQERYGRLILCVEASDAWGDRPMSLLTAILIATGKKERSRSQYDALEDVCEAMNGSRRCLIIEEAHHLGPRTLNTLKTLVNRTPGEFILLALPNLWDKLESRSYVEARQLTGNRLAERIRLDGLDKADVRKYLQRRTELDGDLLKRAADMLHARAVRSGNLAFVRDVATRFVQSVRREGAEENLETLAACMEMEGASR